jgi:hypothetical protein
MSPQLCSIESSFTGGDVQDPHRDRHEGDLHVLQVRRDGQARQALLVQSALQGLLGRDDDRVQSAVQGLLDLDGVLVQNEFQGLPGQDDVQALREAEDGGSVPDPYVVVVED